MSFYQFFFVRVLQLRQQVLANFAYQLIDVSNRNLDEKILISWRVKKNAEKKNVRVGFLAERNGHKR